MQSHHEFLDLSLPFKTRDPSSSTEKGVMEMDDIRVSNKMIKRVNISSVTEPKTSMRSQ